MLSASEQQTIIVEIMKQLKLQADRKRDIVTRKSVVINPQVLLKSNPAEFGPYYFGTSFTHNPNITFGQVRLDRGRPPLVVQPYVDRWISTSGGITGLYLGIYALNVVAPGLDQHTVTWEAVGKGSLYKQNRTNEKWNSAYDNKEATSVVMSAGSIEVPNI